ncbi:mannose-6-phosphate isomerase-like protein (cupin superfamily) [Caulobacter ginsengisoli]|uniref:Mannose-6-phosphate isomerase-like protein (Cupin superfamily) n=1 Tax=Caulobacter ginsengisoli TaxID=400775 RepID=A0ABU0IL77_9CAUL|nr:cupin domain-containing protein [Caulobacter ginsengisoli]MDQ0462773.1 mannose-6-phosphate isomerase-like protein (cupin superfamily) [Caulobacter ginsengisoli]
MTTFDLETTYLGLDGAGEVKPLPVGPDFWATIDRNPDLRANLVAVFGGEGDWPSWEMHPQGDEVLILLEGSMQMVFDRPHEPEIIFMAPGTTVIVPAGVWHRGVDQRGAKLLAITYGAGTDHRPA